MRTIRVFVYRNLQLARQGEEPIYSIKQVETGRVIAHSPRVMLTACRFKVGRSGQARARATGRRNVHAGIEGELVVDPVLARRFSALAKTGRRVRYNPFETTTFVSADGTPVAESDEVYLCGSGVFCR